MTAWTSSFVSPLRRFFAIPVAFFPQDKETLLRIVYIIINRNSPLHLLVLTVHILNLPHVNMNSYYLLIRSPPTLVPLPLAH